MIITLGLILIAYLVFIEPYLRNKSRKYFFTNYKTDKNARAKMYRQDFVRNIFIGFLVISLAWITSISPSELGLRPPSVHQFLAYPLIGKFILVAIFCWFIFYFFFFVTIGVRLHKRFRAYLVNKVRVVAPSAPVTLKDHCWWTANALASAFEELAYRGFVFFLVFYLWPSASIWIAGVIAVLLEAVRYAPRFAAMKYVAERAAVFTLAFIVFHSLWAAIILHVIYNLRIMAVPFHWVQEDEASNKSTSIA